MTSPNVYSPTTPDMRDLHIVPEHQSLPTYASTEVPLLMVWEPPRPGERYVVAADVSDGIGQDRSVADVLRVGTIHRPHEQVAQFISAVIDPVDFAYVLDSIGRFYRDMDGQEALLAVETNNHGVATQSELSRHLGYSNFYVWQWEDVRPDTNRYTRRVGWYTNRRTRPIIITRYVRAVKSTDKVTGLPDYLINSEFTLEELKDFQTEGPLWMAEAAPGAHDDCIMAGAISLFAAQTLYFEQGETLEEQRRRRSWEKQEGARLTDVRGMRRDFINTDCTIDEMYD